MLLTSRFLVRIQEGQQRKKIMATYRPPQGVADAAKRALEWIKDGRAGQGFTDVGRARAAQLANRNSVSEDVIKRMRSYFARHEVDKQGKGFNASEPTYPSPGRVAWDAWGGDAGKRWVNDIKLPGE